MDLDPDDELEGRAHPMASGAGEGPSSRSSARRGAEQRRLVEGAPDQLQPDRQPVPGVQSGRHREARQRRQVAGDGVDVGQVHLQRVVDLLARAEGDGGRDRAGHHVAPLEGPVEVAADQRADLLGLQVVGVVVAGRERVGPEHDAPLDLGAEALVAGLAVHVGEGAGGARGPKRTPS